MLKHSLFLITVSCSSPAPEQSAAGANNGTQVISDGGSCIHSSVLVTVQNNQQVSACQLLSGQKAIAIYSTTRDCEGCKDILRSLKQSLNAYIGSGFNLIGTWVSNSSDPNGATISEVQAYYNTYAPGLTVVGIDQNGQILRKFNAGSSTVPALTVLTPSQQIVFGYSQLTSGQANGQADVVRAVSGVLR